MGKQYYAGIFLQFTVPLLDFLTMISTIDWLNKSLMKDFLKILLYREIFDIIMNLIISILMMIYRFKQISILPILMISLGFFIGFINFIFLGPLLFTPKSYFNRYNKYFEKNMNSKEILMLTYQYKCCGFTTIDQFRSQKCKSKRNPCLIALINNTSGIIKSKTIMSIILTLIQSFAIYLIWDVHQSGEIIELSEEEDSGEESRLLTSKKKIQLLTE